MGVAGAVVVLWQRGRLGIGIRTHVRVQVADRTAVVTTNAETIAVKPTGIQEAIDAEV
ncbi:hypothetical protein Droror1_Dr00015763, partial [Drosera rotundifolia]